MKHKSQLRSASTLEKARRTNEDRPRKAKPVGAGLTPPPSVSASPAIVVVPNANGIILPVGQNIALPSANSALSSVSVSINLVHKEQFTMATLKYRKTDKSGSSSYSIDGLKSSVYFNKGMFAGEAPATLDINLPSGFSFGTPGAKPAGAVAMTKEERAAKAAERKAIEAAKTPAEKAADKIAAAKLALEKAEKAAAKL